MQVFSVMLVWFNARSPRFFIVLYISAIPSFGLAYSFLPSSSFYAPYAHLEHASAADTISLQKILAESIRRELPERLAVQSDAKNLHFSPQTISVNHLAVDADGMLNFDVHAVDQHGPGINVVIVHVAFLDNASKIGTAAWAFPLDFEFGSSSPGQLRYPDSAGDFEALNAIFPSPKDFPNLLSGGFITVNDSEMQKIKAYVSGLNGYALGFSGQFGRMTYFSAIVITTLGLGDIVPIDDASRTLVAFEAIFGIFLAGSFLNALANLRSSS